jgi:hypothetical protein
MTLLQYPLAGRDDPSGMGSFVWELAGQTLRAIREFFIYRKDC